MQCPIWLGFSVVPYFRLISRFLGMLLRCYNNNNNNYYYYYYYYIGIDLKMGWCTYGEFIWLMIIMIIIL